MFRRLAEGLSALAVIASLLWSSMLPAMAVSALPAAAVSDPAPAAWSAPPGAEPIDPSPYGQYHVRVAGDSNGNLFAVWQDYRDNKRSQVRVAFRPAGGAWQPSLRLDSADTVQVEPAIAVDGSGSAYAAWIDQRGGYDQLYFATRPAGGVWGPGQPVSPTSSSSQAQNQPALAVNRRGEAVLVWVQGAGPGHFAVYAALRPAGGPWGAAELLQTISDFYSNFQADAALDDWGRAYVLWRARLDPGLFFSTRPPGGPWSAAENIRSSVASVPWDPHLAVDNAGNAHAVWTDARDGEDIYAAFRPSGGPWSTNVRVNDDAGDAHYMPDVVVDGAGNAIAVWYDGRSDDALYGAVRPRGGGWGPNYKVIDLPAGTGANHASARMARETHLSPAMPSSMSTQVSLVVFAWVLVFAFEAGTDYYDFSALVGDAPAPGASGDCQGGGSGPSALAGAGPSVAALNDHCHAGNGAEPPAVNADDGSPDWPPGDKWDVSMVEEGGKLYYKVIGADGHVGFFDLNNKNDAVAFAAQHAEPAAVQVAAEPPAVLPAPPASPPTPAVQPPPDPAPGEYQVTYSEDPSPQLTPELHAWATASWLVEVSKYRPLTDDEKQDLQAALAAMNANDPHKTMLAIQYEQNVAALAQAAKPAAPDPKPATPVEPPAAAPSGKTKPDKLLNYYQNQYGTKPLSTAVSAVTGGKPKTEPVLLHSGEFVYNQTPLDIPGRGLDYIFHLSYHSQLVYDGPAGWGWEHNYDRRVVATGGGSLGVRDGAGTTGVFSFDGAAFTPSAGLYAAVVSATTGITLTGPGGIVEGYFPLNDTAAAGRLRSIADRNGNTLRFAYDAQGRLETVTDTLNRLITYGYDASGRLANVTDFAGRVVRLAHDANGDLVGITTAAVIDTPEGNDFPQGKTTRFLYTSGFADARLNHNLTTAIAPNEVADGSLVPTETNTYGETGLAFDRVVSQSWGGGRSNASGVPAGGEVTLAYSTAIAAGDPPGAYSKTTVTDRGGNVVEFWHDGAGHRLRSRQVVEGQSIVYDYAYNAAGQLTGIVYPAGNRLEARYDEAAANSLARGNLLEVRRLPDAARGCDGSGSSPCPALVTTYTYEPVFQRIKTATDPRGAITTSTYDTHGNLTGVAYPGMTVGLPAPQTAALAWTYNAWGQPLTYTNAEGGVTRYEYYAAGPAAGYRQRVIRDSGGLGVATTYAYDAVGNIVSETDGRGVRTDYGVNALNQVVKISKAAAIGTDASRNTQYASAVPLDYETLYRYDANDNLVQVDVENVLPDLDAGYHPTGVYRRDAADPWLTTTYAYDLLGNLITASEEISSTAQAITQYRYDPLERLSTLTYPAGNQVAYAYDGAGRLRQVTRGAGAAEAATTRYAYDANGNLTRTTDAEGHLTDDVYDGFDRLAGRVDALGNVRTWRYDANGNVLEVQARDGQAGRNPGRTLTAASLVTLSRSRFSYDERNRLYARQQAYFLADVDTGALTPLVTDGDGDGWVETDYAYDRNGNLTALRNDGGQAILNTYDKLDRLASQTDALNNRLAFRYDGANNLVQIVAAERQPDNLAPTEIYTTTYAYDAVNRLVEVTGSLGATERAAYDSRGNLVFRSDANGPTPSDDFSPSYSGTIANDHGNTSIFSYDSQGRLLAAAYHLREGGVGGGAVIGQAQMLYAYDANGNLVGRTDPNRNVTAYAYDALDRLTRVIPADGVPVTYGYDRAGNLIQRRDPAGNTVTQTYDALDRRVRTDVTRGAGVGGTTLQTYGWDGLSRLVTATDNNDPSVAADDSSLAFTYDSLSNHRRETQDGHTVASTYDGLGNRLTQYYPSGAILTATYDALNRVKSLEDGAGAIAQYDYLGPTRVWRRTNGGGAYVAYAYDGARRVTAVTHRRSVDGALLTGVGYSYDRAGNRLSETPLPAMPGAGTGFAYDSLYRLVRASGPILCPEPLGAGGIAAPALPSAPAAICLAYTYDLAGNRTQTARDGQTIPYVVAAGNRYVSVGGRGYAYDSGGNLTQAGLLTHAYDYLGRLIASVPPLTVYMPLVRQGRTVAGATAAAGIPAAHPSSLTTYDALGRPVSMETGGVVTFYTYAGRDVIEERDVDGALEAVYAPHLMMQRRGARLFYQADASGSVVGLADANGEVVEQVIYDPFGAPVFSTGGHASALGNPYLFDGARYDAGSTLYFAGGRRYDPVTGRYLQPGPETLGNPYDFAGNNPAQSGLR